MRHKLTNKRAKNKSKTQQMPVELGDMFVIFNESHVCISTRRTTQNSRREHTHTTPAIKSTVVAKCLGTSLFIL